jgi:hypothetical protein
MIRPGNERHSQPGIGLQRTLCQVLLRFIINS